MAQPARATARRVVDFILGVWPLFFCQSFWRGEGCVVCLLSAVRSLSSARRPRGTTGEGFWRGWAGILGGGVRRARGVCCRRMRSFALAVCFLLGVCRGRPFARFLGPLHPCPRKRSRVSQCRVLVGRVKGACGDWVGVRRARQDKECALARERARTTTQLSPLPRRQHPATALARATQVGQRGRLGASLFKRGQAWKDLPFRGGDARNKESGEWRGEERRGESRVRLPPLFFNLQPWPHDHTTTTPPPTRHTHTPPPSTHTRTHTPTRAVSAPAPAPVYPRTPTHPRVRVREGAPSSREGRGHRSHFPRGGVGGGETPPLLSAPAPHLAHRDLEQQRLPRVVHHLAPVRA